jgi:hypothetical protein
MIILEIVDYEVRRELLQADHHLTRFCNGTERHAIFTLILHRRPPLTLAVSLFSLT